jgi:hypothetical protein
MKAIVLILMSFLIYFNVSSQSPDCPLKSQRGYKCGVVDEKILDRLNTIEYTMPTKFNLTLENTFKSSKDQIKAEAILDLCNKVLNDSDFWKALEHYDKYKYTVWGANDIRRVVNGMEIVNALINGNPNDDSRPDKINISINIKLYGLSFKTPFETAVAKEINDGNIYNKKWFFRGFPIQKIGSNWIHEYSHTMQFRHCHYCNEARDYSIPYVINRIFEEVAQKYLNENI